tara:strand:+ start:8824 stop:9792 length:969 start_codon:yes stop_codon:yes gene_type:complete
MPELSFENNTYALDKQESVLECLHRNGVPIPSSCLSGVCQSCMMRNVQGELPEAAQKGLKDTWRSQGFFLACQCRTDESLSVARTDNSDLRIKATLSSIEALSSNVIEVRIKPEQPIDYRPGQFMNLVLGEEVIRSYSVASVPELHDQLEFHVALMPDGKMSGWLHKEASPGDSISLQGPLGSCFYTPNNPQQPLLLVGTGTGLAPLYGIVRDALQAGHEAPIHLLHGSIEVGGLYLIEALQQLARDHAHFTYTPCTLKPGVDSEIECGDISELALKRHPDLKGWRVFLCGHPDTVKILQRKVFLAGANMSDILADAFLPSQ